jgi:hypothetical protein
MALKMEMMYGQPWVLIWSQKLTPMKRNETDFDVQETMRLMGLYYCPIRTSSPHQIGIPKSPQEE